MMKYPWKVPGWPTGMNSEGCHPVLKNSDLDDYEQNGWTLNEPISVKLIRAGTAASKVVERKMEGSRPILGNIIERKPKKPVVTTSALPNLESLELTKAQPEDMESQMIAEIDGETSAMIAKMSPEQIREDLEWIHANLPASTIEFLKQRNLQKK